MKILIVSDTHGQEKNLEEVLKKEEPIDALIHLGDLEGGEDFISTHVKCPVYLVSGNNDFFCSLPREREITLGKYKVLITHGHYYYVSLAWRSSGGRLWPGAIRWRCSATPTSLTWRRRTASRS